MVNRCAGNWLLHGHGHDLSGNEHKGQQMTDYFRFAFIGFVEYESDGEHIFILRKYLMGGPKPDEWMWPKSLEQPR